MSDNGDRRLSSWKEIGAFFGKDERTVKRWESQRGLPIHRIPGGARASVFAYASELEGWLKGEGQGSNGANGSPASAAAPSPSRHALAAAALVTAFLVVAGLAYLGQQIGTVKAPPANDIVSAATAHEPPAGALDHYLAGIFNWEKRTPESLGRAVVEFRQAIAEDPNYAEAYVGLANCYNLLREYTVMPASEAYPLAREAAEHALRLNDGLAEAHTALAFVEFYWTRDIPKAKHEFDRALKLDPSSVRAHHWYATALLHMGEFHHALQEINEAQKLDPQSRSIIADKGLILFYDGKVDDAVRLLGDLAQTERDYLSPFAYLAAIYFAERRYPDFFGAGKEAARLMQDNNRLIAVEAAERGYASDGERGMFQAMVAEELQLYSAGNESAWRLAQTYSAEGDDQKALRYLRASLDRHEEYVMAIRIEPAFKSLHGMAEFRTMVSEVGMPPL